ncbi:hypothetical protein [Streptomyces nodosus]|uniref:hypothetical protein n=1 Tax=Streptomyces nodosus TaxID=40318 RepID=UPI0036EAA49D
MKSSLRTRSSRAVVVAVASAALLAPAASVAFADDASVPAPSVTKQADNPEPKTPQISMATIAIKTDKAEVRYGEAVTFTGRTTGLKTGSDLVLQRHDGARWVDLKDHAIVKEGDSYTLISKLTEKGNQRYRVSDGKIYSPEVTVYVK